MDVRAISQIQELFQFCKNNRDIWLVYLFGKKKEYFTIEMDRKIETLDSRKSSDVVHRRFGVYDE